MTAVALTELLANLTVAASGQFTAWNIENLDNVCSWFGVTCKKGRVVELDLRNSSLQGFVTTEVTGLWELQSL